MTSIIGCVNQKTTATSMIVVRPRVNAKPCTPPTARKYRMIAEIRLTAFAARTVRRARAQPRSTA